MHCPAKSKDLVPIGGRWFIGRCETPTYYYRDGDRFVDLFSYHTGMAKDLKKSAALDVCNGNIDEIRGYHYHVTPSRFPYILGGYAGVVESSNNRGLHRTQTGAIEDNTKKGENRMDKVITTVRPGTASRGKTHQVQFELDPNKAVGRRLPDGSPTWVQMGRLPYRIPFKRWTRRADRVQEK